MTRIIVEPASNGNDLSERFAKAISLLNEKAIKLHARGPRFQALVRSPIFHENPVSRHRQDMDQSR
jgi:hypothetical protein